MPNHDSGGTADSIIDLRLRYIEERFPGRLSDDERALVRQRLVKLAESASALERYSLSNSHEPAPVFHPTGKEQE